MPSSRALRQAALLALVAVLGMLAACDRSAPPSPSAVASASAIACAADEIEASGINGSVVDSDGNPLDDILIQIDNLGGFRGTARTAEDGVFTAPGVSGEFVIATVDIGYDSVTQRVTVPCGETIDVELVLTPAGG